MRFSNTETTNSSLDAKDVWLNEEISFVCRVETLELLYNRYKTLPTRPSSPDSKNLSVEISI